MGYKNAELRLGKNDTQLDDPRAGEVALRIDSTGAIFTKPEGAEEVAVGAGSGLTAKPIMSESYYDGDVTLVFDIVADGSGDYTSVFECVEDNKPIQEGIQEVYMRLHGRIWEPDYPQFTESGTRYTVNIQPAGYWKVEEFTGPAYSNILISTGVTLFLISNSPINNQGAPNVTARNTPIISEQSSTFNIYNTTITSGSFASTPITIGGSFKAVGSTLGIPAAVVNVTAQSTAGTITIERCTHEGTITLDDMPQLTLLFNKLGTVGAASPLTIATSAALHNDFKALNNLTIGGNNYSNTVLGVTTPAIP